MGSVSLVLNTRHGTLHNPRDFGSCKWTLADPIYAPPNHNLYAELTFMTITNDQERINAKRRTTNVWFQTRNRETGEIKDIFIQLPPGSYTEDQYLNQIAIEKPFLGIDIQHADENKDPNPEVINRIQTREIVLTNLRMEGNDPKDEDVRLVHDPDWMGAQVLGFHETTPWIEPGGNAIAPSPMDTWGSCTITLSCKTLAGNTPDPVTSTRRRTILKVIPASIEGTSKPYIYERFGPRYGHRITPRCISVIELSLSDDLGQAMDPRHHWCVGLEIYAIKQGKNFMHLL